jgi:hypothetical protein
MSSEGWCTLLLLLPLCLVGQWGVERLKSFHYTFLPRLWLGSDFHPTPPPSLALSGLALGLRRQASILSTTLNLQLLSTQITSTMMPSKNSIDNDDASMAAATPGNPPPFARTYVPTVPHLCHCLWTRLGPILLPPHRPRMNLLTA